MSAPGITVVHLVTPDTAAESWDTINALRGQPDDDVAHAVVRLGRRPAPMAGFRARRAVEHAARAAAHGVVLHAWSPAAAEWCLPMSATHRPLVFNVTDGTSPRRLAAWARSGTGALICQSAAHRSTLLRAGVPEPRCTLIRPGVAADEPSAPDHRALVRRQLRLDEHDVVVAALPPAARSTGTFVATWAVLLLERVRPDVRLIIPRLGCEAERAWRLVTSCGHEHVARVTPTDLSLRDCLAASDLAAYLPSNHAPLDSLAAAIAAGCPIVASAVPAIAELLVQGVSAWLCKPEDPKDAARRMLQAIEEAAQSQRQAERARELARSMFSLPRMIDDYRRLYLALAARRPAACCNQ
jgi:hypothetical protein